MSFEQNRYERLKEFLSEYTEESGTTSEDLFRDIRRACSELDEYHLECLRKTRDLRKLIK